VNRPYGKVPNWTFLKVVTPGTRTEPLMSPRVGCLNVLVDMIRLVIFLKLFRVSRSGQKCGADKTHGSCR